MMYEHVSLFSGVELVMFPLDHIYFSFTLRINIRQVCEVVSRLLKQL